MRTRAFLFALPFVIFLGSAATTPSHAATYGRAEILIPEPQDPLWVYGRACEEETKRRFVVQLKRQYPDISDEKLSERITVRTDEEKSAVVLHVKAEDKETAIACAEEMATMAVRKFMDMDRAARDRLIERITKAKDRLQEKIEKLQRKLFASQAASGLYDWQKQIESLLSRMNSCQDELERGELKRAELEAELQLLSKMAAAAQNAISAEEVALLQKAACEAKLRLDDASKRYGEKHPKRIRLQERLAEIEEELTRARQEFAETGGLHLAPMIAERKLRCEIEMTALKGRIHHLRRRIEQLQREIAEKRSQSLELERRQEEIDPLRERVHALQEEETKVHARAIASRRPEILLVKSVEHIEP